MRPFAAFLLLAIGFVEPALAVEQITDSQEIFEEDGIKMPRDCAKNMYSMMTCMGELHAEADKELNELYDAQLKYLSDPSNRNALKTAQKAWITFRDKDCKYKVGERPNIGNYWSFAMTKCEYKHTLIRIKELKEYVACRYNGCPE